MSGEVEMETTEGLDKEDIAKKLILPCVAVPTMDVTLDA